MSTTFSTTLIALAAIVAATVAVCFHVVTSDQWLSIVGGFGGAGGLLHVIGVTTTNTVTKPSNPSVSAGGGS